MSIPCKINPLGVVSSPASYLPALFLEGTGEQNIAVQTYSILNTEDVFSCKTDCQFLSTGQRSLVGWVGRAGFYWGRENTAIGVGSERLSVDPDQRHTFTFTVTKGNTDAKWVNYLSASGSEASRINEPSGLPSLWQYGLFTYVENTANTGNIRVWSFELLEGGEPCILSPVISASGEPCMYDKITKQLFSNSGSGKFIVGMTAAQACRLGNLPPGGGTLTISLPSAIVDGETVTDAAVQAALDAAAAKGWTITIQTY